MYNKTHFLYPIHLVKLVDVFHSITYGEDELIDDLWFSTLSAVFQSIQVDGMVITSGRV